MTAGGGMEVEYSATSPEMEPHVRGNDGEPDIAKWAVTLTGPNTPDTTKIDDNDPVASTARADEEASLERNVSGRDS
jgi:hypothetical protein